MSDLINKLKKNFLGTQTFNVGFNNKSPVKGVSRKASPLNGGYNPAQASFDGSKGAISSYGPLMESHYGQPEIPDLKDMGKILSESIGKWGKAAGQLGAAYAEAKEGADKEGGDWWDQDSLSRKSSSPLNQFGSPYFLPAKEDDEDNIGADVINSATSAELGDDEEVGKYGDGGMGRIIARDPGPDDGDGKEPTDQDNLIAFCTKNPNNPLCTGKNVNKNWDAMSSSERINDPRLQWD